MMASGLIGDVAALSVIVGMIGGVVAAWRAVAEYRLKSQAQRAQLDIDLARHFAEVVPIANGRGGCVLSETAVAAITNVKPPASEEDLWPALVTLPVGAAAQAAAIRSLAYLGQKHDSLRASAESALVGLEFVDEDPNLQAARAEALRSLRSG